MSTNTYASKFVRCLAAASMHPPVVCCTATLDASPRPSRPTTAAARTSVRHSGPAGHMEDDLTFATLLTVSLCYRSSPGRGTMSVVEFRVARGLCLDASGSRVSTLNRHGSGRTRTLGLEPSRFCFSCGLASAGFSARLLQASLQNRNKEFTVSDVSLTMSRGRFFCALFLVWALIARTLKRKHQLAAAAPPDDDRGCRGSADADEVAALGSHAT